MLRLASASSRLLGRKYDAIGLGLPVGIFYFALRVMRKTSFVRK
jgi:hypothetical protein